MEIARNDRTAKITLPGINSDEITRVTFENARAKDSFTLADQVPSNADGLVGDKHINSYTGIMYVKEAGGWVSKGNRFNNISGELTVPHPFITYAGKFDVQWEYSIAGDEYTEIQQHTVIQPLFTAKDIQDFDPDFTQVNGAALVRLERVVRAIIERTTGQKFELTHGIQTARSYNGQSLVLPKRVVSLDDYSGIVAGVRTRVESDGWILRALNPHSHITQFNANPIYDVYEHGGFKDDKYFLKGEWGYRSVPEQIQLAAMLLAQDYGCDQSVWRDRYIEMMKNVDWSVQFHDKAFEGTGNIKVDQILQSYTVNRLGIV